MEKAPLASVTTPVLVPFTVTLTFDAGFPLSSFTRPFTCTLFCAFTPILSSKISEGRRNLLKRYPDKRLEGLKLPEQYPFVFFFILAI